MPKAKKEVFITSVKDTDPGGLLPIEVGFLLVLTRNEWSASGNNNKSLPSSWRNTKQQQDKRRRKIQLLYCDWKLASLHLDNCKQNRKLNIFKLDGNHGMVIKWHSLISKSLNSYILCRSHKNKETDKASLNCRKVLEEEKMVSHDKNYKIIFLISQGYFLRGNREEFHPKILNSPQTSN